MEEEEFALEAANQLQEILADLAELAKIKSSGQARQKVLHHAADIVAEDRRELQTTLAKLASLDDRGLGCIYAARLIEAAFMIGVTADASRAQILLRKLEDERGPGRKPRSLGIRGKMIGTLQSLYKLDPRPEGVSRNEILLALEKVLGPLGSDKITSFDRALRDAWPRS